MKRYARMLAVAATLTLASAAAFTQSVCADGACGETACRTPGPVETASSAQGPSGSVEFGMRIEFERLSPRLCGFITVGEPAARVEARDGGRQTVLGSGARRYAKWVVGLAGSVGQKLPLTRLLLRVALRVVKRHVGRWSWNGDAN